FRRRRRGGSVLGLLRQPQGTELLRLGRLAFHSLLIVLGFVELALFLARKIVFGLATGGLVLRSGRAAQVHDPLLELIGVHGVSNFLQSSQIRCPVHALLKRVLQTRHSRLITWLS